jgi:uncharacterized membrane protein YdjX (TVP38/TMEM64 family)
MSETASQDSADAPRTRARLVAFVLLAAGLLALGSQAGPALERFRAWVADLGALGPIVFVAGYALATVAFVPGAILTLAAGSLFGVVKGSVYVFLAATLGASLAFLTARHLARGAIEQRVAGTPRFTAIDRAVARDGRRIVFLMRLSPVFPFNLLNYALGLTRVRFVDFVIASLGMVPGTIVYVYLGALGGQAAVAASRGEETEMLTWAFRLLGLAATVLVTVLITRTARRALAEAHVTEGESE